jgi:Bacterial PH domain
VTDRSRASPDAPGGGHAPGRLVAVQWSPKPVRTALVAVAAGLLGLAAAVFVPDLPGRILVGLAAAGLAVDAVRDLVVRPRLWAGPEGVVVRTWGAPRRIPWHGLRARVRATRRLGVLTRTLEIDVDPAVDDDGVLVVLGRRDVGVPVEEVARRLRAMNPVAPERRPTRGPLD